MTLSIDKGQLIEWDKILTNPTTDRGPISKIYKEFKKTDIKIPNTPIKKWGIDINREFLTEESQIAKTHLKSCSTSLAIRETQIKMTLKYHVTPVRMEYKLVQLLWKSIWQFLRKFGINLP